MPKLYEFSKNPLIVSLVASILHIIDEINWGLIPEPNGKKTAISIIKILPSVLKIKKHPDYSKLVNQNDSIIQNWIRVSSWCIVNKVDLSKRKKNLLN
jgi:adenosylcobinamide hydrolase